MNEKDMKELEAMMTRVVGVFSEDVQHTFELLAEGHKMLAEKLDRVEGRLSAQIDNVDQRLTVMSVGLSAHRGDTESHLNCWGVREEK